jgi:ribonuclease P protein component
MDSVHGWPPRGAGLCSSHAVRRGVPALAPDATSGFGFPRAARLTRPSEFTRVFRQGHRSHSRYFILIAKPGGERARLGLAIGRKASPRAVVRNRIKRIVRDAFRHTALPPMDLVVVARNGSGRTAVDALRKDFQAALEGLKQ